MQKKIIVPEGMLKAAAMGWGKVGDDVHTDDQLDAILEAALQWLSENPIVPTIKQVMEVRDHHYSLTGETFWQAIIVEWQRRMLIAPEPESPKEVEDLLCEAIQYPAIPLSIERAQYNRDIIEAFRRGQKSK